MTQAAPAVGQPASAGKRGLPRPLSLPRRLWQQALAVRPDADGDESQRRYVRSYLLMRVAIGALGVGLPLTLLLGDTFLLSGSVRGRPSLSAYYYSGMRDEFVGIIAGVAMFLVFYHVSDRTIENVVTTVAGAAGGCVSIFPTGRPDPGLPLTPLQNALGEGRVATVHMACASAFFACLALVSYFFGHREGELTPPPGQKLPPAFWRTLHYVCCAVMVAAMAFVMLADLDHWWSAHATWVGETAGLTAFGVSWFAKGANLRTIFHLQR